MNIYNLPGSSNTASFPHDASCPGCLQFCKSISRHYPNGVFKYGVPFAPAISRAQRDAVKGVLPSPLPDGTYPAFVPFTHWQQYIPCEHCTSNIGLRVEPDISSCCPDRSCCSGDPAGMTFSLVFQIIDQDAYNADSQCNIDDHILTGPTDITLAPIAADVYSFTKIDFDNDVPTGQTLMVGIRVDTPPTDSAGAPAGSGQLKLACLKSRITPVITTENFAAPIQAQ